MADVGVVPSSGRSGASGGQPGCTRGTVGGSRSFCSGCCLPAHGDHLATGGRRQRRLSELLLGPCLAGTQDRIGRHAIDGVGVANLAFAGAIAVGDRRFAHQAVRAEGRGGRRASQPDVRTGRPTVLAMVTCGSRSRSPCVIRSGAR